MHEGLDLEIAQADAVYGAEEETTISRSEEEMERPSF